MPDFNPSFIEVDPRERANEAHDPSNSLIFKYNKEARQDYFDHL